MTSSKTGVGVFDDLFTVDRICRNFERAWQKGGTLDIEQCLANAPAELHASLFPELLALEAEYRCARGETLEVQEFLERFPEQEQTIAEFWKSFDPSSFPGCAVHDAPNDSRTFNETSHISQSNVENDFPSLPGYQFIEILGHGGMGIVYKARHKRLGRFVAVKMIAPMKNRPGVLARFEAEAGAIAGLQHPNIVQLFEAGRHRGQPYFTLEYVDGGTLKTRLQKQSPAPRETAELVTTLARAIHYAHSHGIIHRDLKPSNILCTAAGELKITDFGLAKLVLQDKEATRSGEVIGSPIYMSPEQATGQVRNISPVSDVYSLGVILYEMLVGQPPFQGESVLEVLHQVKTSEPLAPRRLKPGLPRDLESICLRCLEKNPTRRYGSADALADDLERFLRGEPTVARPITGAERLLKWIRRHPAAAAVISVLLLSAATLLGASLYFNSSLQKERDDALFHKQLAEKHETQANLQKSVALAKAEEARVAQLHAEKMLQRSEINKYALQLSLARNAYEAGDIGTAVEILSQCRTDLRHWEFYYLNTLCRRRMQTIINKYPTAILDACFSPDGQRVAAALSHPGRVRIWNARSGEQLFDLKGHDHSVSAVTFSPGGRQIASASADRTIILWDARTGKRLRTMRGHKERVRDVVFHPNGKELASASWDGTIRIWDPASGKELRKLSHPKGYVYAVDYSPDGRLLVSAGMDKTVRLWDAASGQEMRTFKGHTNHVFDVVFSPDGKQLASCSSDATIRLWETATGKQLKILKRDTESVSRVAFRPDGRQLASIGADRAVRLWDILSGIEVAQFKGHTHNNMSIAYDPKGQHILSGSMDGTVRIWKLDLPSCQTLAVGNKSFNCVAFHPDSKHFVLGEFGGGLHVWQTEPVKRTNTIKQHTGLSRAVVYSPCGKWLASSAADGTLVLRDNKTGKILWRKEFARLVGTSLAFTRDSKLLACGNITGNITIYDSPTGKVAGTLRVPQLHQFAQTFKAHAHRVVSLAFSPDSKYLASASWDNTARVWDVKAKKQSFEFTEHKNHVSSVSFSHDGKWLLTAGWDGSVQLWDIAGGKDHRCLFQKMAKVNWAIFSNDGKRIITGSDDKTVRLWEPETGQQLFVLRDCRQPVQQFALSPDNSQLVAVSNSMSAVLWQADKLP